MTTSEILTILEDTNKCYAGKMTQGRYHRTICAIKAGICKPNTLKKFMEDFGFELIKDEQEWKRL